MAALGSQGARAEIHSASNPFAPVVAVPGLRGRMAFVVLSHVLTPDLVAGRQLALKVNRESKYAVQDHLSTQRPGLGVDPVFAVQSNGADGEEECDENDARAVGCWSRHPHRNGELN